MVSGPCTPHTGVRHHAPLDMIAPLDMTMGSTQPPKLCHTCNNAAATQRAGIELRGRTKDERGCVQVYRSACARCVCAESPNPQEELPPRAQGVSPMLICFGLDQLHSPLSFCQPHAHTTRSPRLHSVYIKDGRRSRMLLSSFSPKALRPRPLKQLSLSAPLRLSSPSSVPRTALALQRSFRYICQTTTHSTPSMSGSTASTTASVSRKQPPWRTPEAKPVPKLKLYNSMTRSKVLNTVDRARGNDNAIARKVD
jgi:hypothetical protein